MRNSEVKGPSPDILKPKGLIAPAWHTAVMLLLLSIPIVLGVLRLFNSHPASSPAGPLHLANLWKFYAQTLIYEWFLVLFLWIGIRLKGNKLRDLIGGRWPTIGRALIDVAIGAAVCVAMFFIGDTLGKWLNPASGNVIDVLPKSGLEIALWLVLSGTAGFAEEVVFRGYLQTQFTRFGMPVVLAIGAQTLIFAVGHIYEGLNSVIIIAVFAAMLGVLAASLRTLRPLIIGHVIYDIAAALRSLS